MKYFKRLLALTTLITLIMAGHLSGKASAATYVLDSPYGDTHLSDKQWCLTNPKNNFFFALSNCDTGGGTAPFNKDTDSYVIFKQNITATTDYQNHTINYNRYKIFWTQKTQGSHLQFYKDIAVGGTNQYYVKASDVRVPVFRADIIAEPNTDPDYRYNWTGAYANGQYQTTGVASFIPNQITNWKGYIIGSDVYSAEVAAVNAEYLSSWDLEKFTDHPPTVADVTTNCSPLDIQCWLGNFGTKISDTFRNFLIAVFDGLAKFFLPDTNAIGVQFNNLKAFLNQKLGFITYPFTFFYQFFAAFTQTGGFCGPVTCVYTVGNFMGAPYQIDLTQARTSLPGLWTLLTTISRGLLVLGLIYSIRREFHATMAK